MNFLENHAYVLISFFLSFKITGAESQRSFREAYGEHAPSQEGLERWFRRFTSDDFNVAEKKHGKPPEKYECEIGSIVARR